MMTTIISIIYLMFPSLTIRSGQMRNIPHYDKPLLYNSVVVELLLNLSIFPFLGLSIFLIFYSWKLLIILFVAGILLSSLIILPIVERIIIYPLYNLVRHRS